ncbi:MAG: hypothetical protein ACLQGP_03370 [Isosphaeraceae bacterium]
MGRIIFDLDSGRLAEDLIWRFGVVTDWERSLDLGWAFGEWLGVEESEAVRDCPSDPTHETDRATRRIAIQLCEGRRLPDFLALTNHGFEIASSKLVERLRASGLTGYQARDGVDVAVNRSSIRLPSLHLFHVVGRAGFCRRWRVVDAPNLCPYCESEPILCSGCGWRSFFDCPKCGKRVHHGGGYLIPPDGKSLNLEGQPEKIVVEAQDWDGSDLFCVRGEGGGWFANRRARDWFERARVIGIEFEPALLNIEGLGSRLPDGSPI